MKLVYTRSLKPQMILARPLYSEKGTLLLAEGIQLNERLVGMLDRMEVPFVYVRDDRFPDLEVRPLISHRNLGRAIRELHRTYEDATRNSTKAALVADFDQLFDVVRSVLDEVLSQPDLVVHLLDVRSNDGYSYQHSVQTMILSMMIGRRMALPEAQLHNLGLGALLAGIGKAFIPSRILTRSGPLSREERELLYHYPRFGWELLEGYGNVWPTARIVTLQHQERWNGSGYPSGLKGEEIHLFSRIVAVADVHDALVSRRPWREALRPYEAFAQITAESGGLFDPAVVDIYQKIVTPYPIGTWLYLSTGHIGMVTDCFVDDTLRPQVRIVRHERTGPLSRPLTLDMRQYPDLEIGAVLDGEPEGDGDDEAEKEREKGEKEEKEGVEKGAAKV